jgi:predicted phosphoribosyltransferase
MQKKKEPKIYALSRCNIVMRFKDRAEAGRLLAKALAKYENEDVVVFALPRGGVVLGNVVANYLHAQLDLLITRKIGYPGNEECAVCAVAEEGDMICDSNASRLDQEWLRARAEKERQEAKRRRQVYLAGRGSAPVENKVAIIVDDGVATGLTILLAIMVLKNRHPKKIVVAVPVSSPDAAARIRAEADELVALDVPEYFMAVGEHYEQFPQLRDEDVIRYMNQQMT